MPTVPMRAPGPTPAGARPRAPSAGAGGRHRSRACRMRLVGRAMTDRAFAFRKATETRRRDPPTAQTLGTRTVRPNGGGRRARPCPFEPGRSGRPLDPGAGGPTARIRPRARPSAAPPLRLGRRLMPAGSAFRDGHLAHMASDTERPRWTANAVSRAGPAYLHYGQDVAVPHRPGGRGDRRRRGGEVPRELLVWRRWAYAFCRFVPDHKTLCGDSRAGGARESGRRGARPARRPPTAWERRMSAPGSHPPNLLMDMQRKWSLCAHGELHNNLRI